MVKLYEIYHISIFRNLHATIVILVKWQPESSGSIFFISLYLSTITIRFSGRSYNLTCGKKRKILIEYNTINY